MGLGRSKGKVLWAQGSAGVWLWGCWGHSGECRADPGPLHVALSFPTSPLHSGGQKGSKLREVEGADHPASGCAFGQAASLYSLLGS